jgi:hypothetical protein
VELSPGAAATLQYLTEHPRAARQHDIAAAIGVSQPRVSQVLAGLGADGLVRRTPAGWVVVDPAHAFDILAGPLRRTTGLADLWYGLAPPRAQIAAVFAAAEAANAAIRLCGDWAADLLAPWRQPGVIVVHADATLALDDAGFVPANTGSASLLVRIDPIRPAWRPDMEIEAILTKSGAPGPLAPVTEIARELRAARASDADEAIDELKRAWLRARELRSNAVG